MRRLFYTVLFNFGNDLQTNEKVFFPFCPAIEGKTIIGISTYNSTKGGALRAINNQPFPSNANLANVFVNFSNKDNVLIIQDYPYNALINTDIRDINNNQSRALKQPFAFVFSSKYSYIVNKGGTGIKPDVSLQFRFEYLDI